MNICWTLNWFSLAGKSFRFSDELFFVSLSLWTYLSFKCAISCMPLILFFCCMLYFFYKWFESPFIVGFQICSLKRDKFEFRTFFCSCHTCSCLVIVVECFLQPQSQIFRDFLNFVHLTSDWTKSNGTQFETEIPCTNLGIYVLVSTASLFEVLKLISFSFT